MWFTAVGLALFTWLMWKCLKGCGTRTSGPLGVADRGLRALSGHGKAESVLQHGAGKEVRRCVSTANGKQKMIVVNSQRATRQFYEKAHDFLGTPEWTTYRMQTETVDNYLFMPFSLRYCIHRQRAPVSYDAHADSWQKGLRI